MILFGIFNIIFSLVLKFHSNNLIKKLNEKYEKDKRHYNNDDWLD